jgi:hypothetical protein
LLSQRQYLLYYPSNIKSTLFIKFFIFLGESHSLLRLYYVHSDFESKKELSNSESSP